MGETTHLARNRLNRSESVQTGPKSRRSTPELATQRSGRPFNPAGSAPVATSTPAAFDENAGRTIVSDATKKQGATNPAAFKTG